MIEYWKAIIEKLNDSIQSYEELDVDTLKKLYVDASSSTSGLLKVYK